MPEPMSQQDAAALKVSCPDCGAPTDQPCKNVDATSEDRTHWGRKQKAGAFRLPAAPSPNSNGQDPADDDDPNLDQFLDTDEPPYEWVVPGLIERGDRVILTGPEGGGKSTLHRQMGLQCAAGVHPFTLEPVDPLNVLLVDCENSVRQARRKFRELHDLVDRQAAARLRIRVLSNAIDLADDAVLVDLAGRIRRYSTDLLLIGPLYKLIHGDPLKELPAKEVADGIDFLRAIRQSAVFIEAHSPYSDNPRGKRPIRPYGASLWSRWPEFGLYLPAGGGRLEHWRGAREERDWPASLQWGQPWPWVPGPVVADQQDKRRGPTRCADAIVALLAEGADELSTKDLTAKLRARGLSYRNETITAAAWLAVDDGRLTHRRGAHNAHMWRAAGDRQGPLDEGF